jgi:hypothetical protein
MHVNNIDEGQVIELLKKSTAPLVPEIKKYVQAEVKKYMEKL